MQDLGSKLGGNFHAKNGIFSLSEVEGIGLLKVDLYAAID